MRKFLIVSLLSASIGLISCDSGLFQPAAPNATVAFNYDLSSVLVASLAATGSRASAMVSEPIVGTLSAHKSGESVPEIFSWFASIDEGEFTIESEKTVILEPGTYDFILDLTHSTFDHRYYGEAVAQPIIDGTNTVNLTLQPIIGSTTVNTAVTEIASIRLSYPVSDIAALEDPRVAVVMSTPPVTEELSLNKNTGESDSYFLVAGGAIIDELLLFEGPIQIGESLDTQENIVIVPGSDITMDLIPLYGETVFALDLATGDATFTVTIPAVIVEEVGGDPANLVSFFAVYGPFGFSRSDSLSFADAGNGTYTATATFFGFEYMTVDIDILFSDAASPGDPIGTALEEGVVLTMNDQSISWNVELRRRALITGNMMAVLGVNVFDATTAAPVSGASVYVDGALKGHTNDGTIGTDGYLKLYLVAGSYTISAESGALGGSAPIVLSPLEIANVDVLVEPIPGGPPATGTLYWMTSGISGAIQSARFDGTQIGTLGGVFLAGPENIAVDPVGGKIYWADFSHNKIRRANLDGGNPEDLLASANGPTGIALDLDAGKVYWTIYGTFPYRKIQRANLDGTGAEDVYALEPANPYGLAFDAVSGKLYWADPFAGKILRSNGNGSDVEEIVTTGLDFPCNLAVDPIEGKVYWTEPGTDKIRRCNIDGSAVEDVATGQTGLNTLDAIAIAPAAGFVFWTNLYANSITAANVDGTGVVSIVTGIEDIRALTVLQNPIDITFDVSDGAQVQLGESFSVQVSGLNPVDDGSYSYSWYLQGVLQGGVTGQSIALSGLEIGTYRLSVVIQSDSIMSSKPLEFEVVG